MGRLRGKLTYANVMSTLCFFLLVTGGAAYAASHLGKNSVGTKQLKKNSVTTTKIKNGAVTGAKVKDRTLTGTQINVSTLGTVPSATDAQHAQTADAIQAPEALHLVGGPGEPPFAPTWKNFGSIWAVAAFYKDREGVVHLQGTVEGNNTKNVVFTLPPAYRPAASRSFAATGNGGTFTSVIVYETGEVRSGDQLLVNIDGITWRAGQ